MLEQRARAKLMSVLNWLPLRIEHADGRLEHSVRGVEQHPPIVKLQEAEEFSAIPIQETAFRNGSCDEPGQHRRLLHLLCQLHVGAEIWWAGSWKSKKVNNATREVTILTLPGQTELCEGGALC